MLVKQVTHFPNSFMDAMLGTLRQSTGLVNSTLDQSSVYKLIYTAQLLCSFIVYVFQILHDCNTK